MKQVVITLTLGCKDDVPPHVLEWMAANLAEHAANEFDGDYDPDFPVDGVNAPYRRVPLAKYRITASVAVAFDPFAGQRREFAATLARAERLARGDEHASDA